MRALEAYSWRQAAGRLLLRRLRGGTYQPEGFAGCVPLAPPHTFIVATCEWVSLATCTSVHFCSATDMLHTTATRHAPAGCRAQCIMAVSR